MKRSSILLFVSVLVVTVLAVIYLALAPSIPFHSNENAQVLQGGATGKASIGGSFTLQTMEGKTARDTDFHGKFVIVFFGFTHCPDMCPTDLQLISQLMESLGDKAAKVQPLFITLDPKRDTPEQMSKYLQGFDKRILGLTGTEEEIAAILKSYRVSVDNSLKGDAALLSHSAFIYVLDEKGQYLTHFLHGTPADQMREKLEGYL